ncbi:MAG: acetyl-CoA synthetase [Gammaproteobacteria bacterium]|nr:MAG: acetyl-CoA synthetase [Gammaproteobacteria bacterium]
MTHHLDPLLRPASIAIVGASASDGVGRRILETLLHGQYPGALYAINPKYDDVLGVPCFPDLAALPEPVEHVVFAVSDHRIEAIFEEAVKTGVKAMTIMSMLYIDNDMQPPLKERIQARVQETGVLVCGANGMGFYNFADRVTVGGFATRPNHIAGNVALISHSGSGMAGIMDSDERINFNLTVSAGQELSVGMHDYLDFALEMPTTEVVGLFMETVREPDLMIEAFKKATRKQIPIVVIKTGKTKRSAELTVSHSGALAGSDECYNAVFSKFGIQRVNDMNELADTLIMFAQPHSLAEGNLVTIHDSGGERQLILDLAADQDVDFAELNPETILKLEEILDPGLPAVNPLDAWGRGLDDSDQIMADSLTTMLQDQNASMGAVVQDRGALSRIYPEYLQYMKQANDATGKPVFLVSNIQGTSSDNTVMESTARGLPILDGVYSFLAGVRCMHRYRDYLAHENDILEPISTEAMTKWQQIIDQGQLIGENEALEMLSDNGIAVNQSYGVDNLDEVIESAKKLGYPVVLKTAVPGISHKSEVHGVYLNLNSDKELTDAYKDLDKRLGPEALLSKMIDEEGVEMILGMTTDPQFGPMITLGFGGVYAEALKDVVTLMPPFNAETAKQALSELKMQSLLSGYRGSEAADVESYCKMASKFSLFALAMRNHICEIDVNPIILGKDICLGLDALMVVHADNKN